MIKQIIERLKDADKIALFHHKRPDGDTLTSSYGLGLALRSVFPNKEVKVVANKPDLFERWKFINFDETMFIDEIDSSWTTIIGDCSEIERIDRAEEFEKGKVKLCFDHHQTNSEYNFDVYWREPNWIASSLQAVEIAKELDVKFDENIAFHLMIGILTDSGGFVFSRANSHPVKSFGFLLDFISDEKMDQYYKDTRVRTQQDLKIEAFMFANMEYIGKSTILKVTQKQLDELGIEEKDIKIKVNRLGNIEGFDRWALFTEMYEDKKFFIKGYMRSLGANVQAVAKLHGGGGHIRAAGVIAKDWAEVEQIVKELNE